MNNPNQQPTEMGFFDRLLGGQAQGQGLESLARNPLFNMGMGLLQSRYDSKVNPFQAAMSGLLSSTEEQQEYEDRMRKQQARDAQAEYFRELQRMQEQTRQNQLAQQQGYRNLPQGFGPRAGYSPDQLQPQMRAPTQTGLPPNLHNFAQNMAWQIATRR